jgi:hypothetical protein
LRAGEFETCVIRLGHAIRPRPRTATAAGQPRNDEAWRGR